jgi:hypothetical protein
MTEESHVQVTDDPRVGTELAGYRVDSLLGWGGMSVVYLSEDLRLKCKVALKLHSMNLAEDESFRERFLRESELAASIDHPNIVPIYEDGRTEDRLIIAKHRRHAHGHDRPDALGSRARRPRRRVQPEIDHDEPDWIRWSRNEHLRAQQSGRDVQARRHCNERLG